MGRTEPSPPEQRPHSTKVELHNRGLVPVYDKITSLLTLGYLSSNAVAFAVR
jgi:hypothetical protein